MLCTPGQARTSATRAETQRGRVDEHRRTCLRRVLGGLRRPVLAARRDPRARRLRGPLAWPPGPALHRAAARPAAGPAPAGLVLTQRPAARRTRAASLRAAALQQKRRASPLSASGPAAIAARMPWAIASA